MTLAYDLGGPVDLAALCRARGEHAGVFVEGVGIVCDDCGALVSGS